MASRLMLLHAILLLQLDVALGQTGWQSLPRWGQATAIVNDVLFVHGGKTDEYNAYSYTSAPNNDDLLSLSLSSAFELSTPPWNYTGGSSNACATQGPTVAWHTLSAFSAKSLLLFGGDAGASAPSLTDSQSAALLDISNRSVPAWNCEAQAWASEPMRRIHHATASRNGCVWLIGGEKDDGSGQAFADHFIFEPSVPQFTPLGVSGGPADVYGHSAIMLADGRLLVFGGYTASTGIMNPLSTVWVLNTTQSNAVWTTASVSTVSLPLPRRGFASTLLDGGQILVHGGADAALETTYSDGWTLETTQEPWTWTPAIALSQLGARRDHFAVQYGSSVLFGFGYGSDGPANVSLLAYDLPSGSFVSSYTPSPNPTPIQTLPSPSSTGSSGPTGTGGVSGSGGSTTATGGSGSGDSGSGSGTPTGSSTGTTSTSGGGSGGSSSGSSNPALAITLGTVFGVLGLVAGTLLTSIYLRRRKMHQDMQRFHPIAGSDDDWDAGFHDTSLFADARTADRTRIAGLVGIGAAAVAAATGIGRAAPAQQQQQQQRRDMLADEDTSAFDYGYNPYYGVQRQGSGSTSSSSGRRRERMTFGEVLHGSWASLRNVGEAMLAAGTKGIRSREPSRREKRSGDGYEDEAALMRDDAPGGTVSEKVARPRGGRQHSSASSRWSYADPFADQGEASETGAFPAESNPFQLPPIRTSINSVQLGGIGLEPPLSPVSEQPSLGTSSNPSRSSQDIGFLSHPSLEVTRSPANRSSILDTGTPTAPGAPMRRSDSWWSRFSRTSFLDRRGSDAGRSSHALDFRDPNPAPRLGPIDEGSFGNSPESTESPNVLSGQSLRRQSTRVYAHHALGTHQRSATSLQTTRTADSEAINKIGAMDVVMRAGTLDSTTSHSVTPSVGSMYSPESAHESDVEHHGALWGRMTKPLSIVVSSNGGSGGDASDRSGTPTASSVLTTEPESDAEPIADIPLVPLARERPRPMSIVIPPTISSSSPKTPTVRSSTPGSAVAARVHAYERRMSQDVEAARVPLSPDERNTRKQERRKSGRPSVNYGLVPKPSLYVANPDGTNSTHTTP